MLLFYYKYSIFISKLYCNIFVKYFISAAGNPKRLVVFYLKEFKAKGFNIRIFYFKTTNKALRPYL
ncbi:hypothetical protein BSV1_A031 (plasmid) [Borreliella finlandensis]|uniref:Uncharacterized protein n=1 Tax=Borreliella finlandensis TaxID=498741 RepID=A0A806C7H9_9SPIR|nr:hypothetical protein BSV1_A031 [Borreliella finlandensis]